MERVYQHGNFGEPNSVRADVWGDDEKAPGSGLVVIHRIDIAGKIQEMFLRPEMLKDIYEAVVEHDRAQEQIISLTKTTGWPGDGPGSYPAFLN